MAEEREQGAGQAAVRGLVELLQVEGPRLLRWIERRMRPELRAAHDAEDVLQDAVSRTLRGLQAGGAPRSPRALVLRMARDRILDLQRSATVRGPGRAEGGGSAAGEPPRPHVAAGEPWGPGALVRREEVEALAAALLRLPPEERTVLVLRRQGLSFETIAFLLQRPSGSARKLHQRARQRLAAVLRRGAGRAAGGGAPEEP